MPSNKPPALAVISLFLRDFATTFSCKNMTGKSNTDFLDILVGEKLSSVTFVMDYSQVDFDGNRFTFYIWPVVTVDKVEYKFGDQYYRDKLCSLITKVVTQASYVDNQEMNILFGDNAKLNLPLDQLNPNIVAEIAVFTDINEKWYVFQ